jgi:hypothetical protein
VRDRPQSRGHNRPRKRRRLQGMPRCGREQSDQKKVATPAGGESGGRQPVRLWGGRAGPVSEESFQQQPEPGKRIAIPTHAQLLRFGEIPPHAARSTSVSSRSNPHFSLVFLMHRSSRQTSSVRNPFSADLIAITQSDQGRGADRYAERPDGRPQDIPCHIRDVLSINAHDP